MRYVSDLFNPQLYDYTLSLRCTDVGFYTQLISSRSLISRCLEQMHTLLQVLYRTGFGAQFTGTATRCSAERRNAPLTTAPATLTTTGHL